MNMKKWERDLQVVTENLEKINGAYEKSPNKLRRMITPKKLAVQKEELRMKEVIDQFSHLNPNETSIGKRRSTLVLWGKDLSGVIQSFYQTYSEVYGQKMWLKLVQVRLNKDSRAKDFDDLEVLSMTNRLEELKKTEKVLSDELRHLNREESKLMKNYQRYLAIKSNAAALSSLSDIRKGTHDSTLSAMGSYLKWLTLPLRGSTNSEKKRNKLQQLFVHKSSGLLNLCRGMLQPSGEVKMAVGDKAIEKIESHLFAIESLKSEIDVLNEKILTDSPQTLKPIVVKKNHNQAKYPRQ